MTTPPPDEEPPSSRAEGEEPSTPPGSAAPTKTRWHFFLHMMLSPMAFLAPCVSCGAAVSFHHTFGTVGGLLGAIGGFILGTALVVFWYVVVEDVFGRDRQARFASQAIEEAEAGRFRRRLGGPAAEGQKMQNVEAVPLYPEAIDIDTGIGTAIARIDAHGDAKEALTAAEKLRDRHPRDPRTVSALARALLRAGKPKEGARLASEALHAAVLAGHLGPVAPLVQCFWAHREALALDSAVARAVANHLDGVGQPDQAAYFRAGRTSLV